MTCSIIFLHPFIKGGAVEYYMLRQAKYLADKGYDTYILTTNIIPHNMLFDTDNMIKEGKHKVKILTIEYGTKSFLKYQPVSSIHIIKLSTVLRRLIKEREILLYIHNHGAPLWYINMILSLRAAGKKLSIIFHPWFHPWRPHSKSSTILAINRLIAKMASVIISNSHVEAFWIAKYLSNRNVIVCYPGVEVPQYTSCAEHVRPSEEYILFVGRIEPRKGLHAISVTLPRLIKQTPNLKFVMVGSVGDYNYYMRIIKYFELKGISKSVVHYSKLSRGELASLYTNAIALLHPAHFESFGFTIIEAMKLSLPPIVTPTGIAPEVVKDGVNGCLLYYTSQHAVYDYSILSVRPAYLKNRILFTYKNRDLLGNRARETVKNRFSWDSSLKRLDAIIDYLAKRL